MFYDPIRVQILRRLHQANPSLRPDLTESEVLFKPPQTVSGNGGNTTVEIQARPVSASYTGSITVTYSRWYLAYFMFGLSVPGKPGDYATTREAFAALVGKYRLPMSGADVTDTPLDESAQRISLTSAPNSLAVYGQANNIRYDDTW